MVRKKEANFQTIFSHWWKSQWRVTGLYELKQTTTDSLPFSSVVPHQIEALVNVKHHAVIYKMPDLGYQNPADCWGMAGEKAFVVIKYLSFFCLIDIDAFIIERDASVRKSLTSERARAISSVVVEN